MPASSAPAAPAPSRRRQLVADLLFAAVALTSIGLLRVGLADPGGGAFGAPATHALRTAARAGILVAAAYLLVLGWRAWRGGRVAFWSRLRALLVAAVVGWAAFLIGDQPSHPPRVAMAMGVALAGFCLLCLLARPIAWFRWPRTVRALDVGATLLCVVALGLELGLRAASALLDSPLLARADASVAEMLGRFRFAPGTPRYGFPCNTLGHYDEEFTAKEAGVPLVACLGDSFSSGIVPHHFHYTTVLERLLPPLRVHNLGLPSIGPAEYLHLLRTEALPLRPDLVLIGVFVGNDIGEGVDVQSPRLAAWFRHENVLLAAVPTRLLRIWRERRRLGRSELGIVGEQAAGRASLAEVLRRYPHLLDHRLEPETHSEVEFLRIQRHRAHDVFRPGHPDKYPRFFALADAIVAAARPTPVLFVLIPDAMQVDDALWQQVVAALPESELERDLPQRLLRAHFEGRGHAHVDLLPAFRRVPPEADGQRHLYQRRDTHFNVRGNLRAAAALAGPVAAQLALTAAPAVAGRAFELAFEPASAATAAGRVVVSLPGHPTLRVAVAPGETGVSVGQHLGASLAEWGVSGASPLPGVVRVDGVVHHPPPGGLGLEVEARGLEVVLTLPLGAPWPAQPEVRVTPETEVETLARSDTVLRLRLRGPGGVFVDVPPEPGPQRR